MNDKTLFRWRAETGFLVLRESYEFIFRYLFRYLIFDCLINALKIGILRVSQRHHQLVASLEKLAIFFILVTLTI